MTRPLEELIRAAASPEPNALQLRAAGRLMTLLERDPQRFPELLPLLPQASWPQPQLVLGITGAPGSGKSTLADALLSEWRKRSPNTRLGVIAVDPSSPFTGGSVLGDRVRMMQHATDPMIFIRSLATRGHLGGLSLGVRGVLHVMALIGCSHVIIETVGVGQSEVEIARVADLVAVVLAPGHGDAIQLLKAGLIEAGDLFVVNKADREGASQLYTALVSTLNLAPLEPDPARSSSPQDRPSHRKAKRPDVFLVSATDRTGVEELATALERLTASEGAQWRADRGAAVLEEAREAVLVETRRRLLAVMEESRLHQVLSGELSVSELAHQLLERAAATPNCSLHPSSLSTEQRKSNA